MEIFTRVRRLQDRLSISAALISGITIPLLPATAEVHESWEFGFQTGYLVQAGDNTPIDYHLIPIEWIALAPNHFSGSFGDSGKNFWSIRPRFALITEIFAKGPESYYLALSAAPVLTIGREDFDFAWFAMIGGGFGALDSTDVEGGQGQDFTLNWFAQSGITWAAAENITLLGGIMFQHLSNGGQTDPNPGIDAVGFTFGISGSF